MLRCGSRIVTVESRGIDESNEDVGRMFQGLKIQQKKCKDSSNDYATTPLPTSSSIVIYKTSPNHPAWLARYASNSSSRAP